ncbi:T9SS type A sorting domain-containing protein [Rubrivirga sp.]|uniref:T9SS type A sorting domain-containing protein n=1 Tax=Rubrivirga sp. TaxID=1885344 RepID=UPI003C7281F2
MRLALLLAFALPVAAQTDADLLEAARAFPPMPRESLDLLQGGFVAPGDFTFGSGTPYNDLEYTAFDSDYMEGETNGFDTFLPVDPSDVFPGEGTVKLVRGVNNLDLEAGYSGPRGDRIILGTAEIAVPFFSRGPDGVDDDYAVVQNVDYGAPMLQLRGEPGEYRLPYYTRADGVSTEGHYLFHTASGQPDLVAFVFPCDDLGSTISGNPPRNDQVLCNDSRRLDLEDGVTIRYAEPFAPTPALEVGTQIGTRGREIVGGVAADGEGRVYLFGASDGSVGGGLEAENTIYVAQALPDGSRGWTVELPVTNGTLLFDAEADDRYLYAVGRTLGALPGFQNAGRWDAIILKIDLEDGTIVATDQYGQAGLDGYGNVELDGDGNLYLSGAGSPEGATGTDPDYLVAKHSAETLEVVWRVTEAPDAHGPVFVSEAWGGLSVVPARDERPAQLLAGGWYMSAGGAAGFLSLYEGIDTDQPRRVAATSINAPGTEADWVLDNAIGSDGRIYAVGYTTGVLEGAAGGDGDAWIGVFDNDLEAERIVQVGSEGSDLFRTLDLGPDGTLYATGYTYGDLATANPDPRTGDAFARSFTPDLEAVASVQLGTAGEDRGFGHLENGVFYVGGMTEASLSAPSAGSFDGYVIALDPETLEPVARTSVSTGSALEAAPLAVFPNPASSWATVRFATSRADRVRITVVDALGRTVLEGDHSLAIGTNGLEVDLAGLVPGVYVVRVEGGGSSLSAPLTVVR